MITVTIEDQAFESTKYEYDFGSIHLTTFICHLQQGEPKLTEHEAIVWLPVEELESLEWAPADIPTVEKLKTIKL